MSRAHASDPRTFLPAEHSPLRADESRPQAVDPIVQIVWPHDRQGNLRSVTEGPLVNLAIDLFHHPFPSLPNRSVGFGFQNTVRLLRSLNDGYLDVVKVADGVSVAGSGDASWPRWAFNDVDVSSASDPANKYYFAVSVSDIETHTTIWSHGADARTYFPHKDVPTRSC